MSYHLIDFSAKDINWNFDNVVIGKKIKMDESSSKYYIYYEHDDELKEIYIKLPKLRQIYNLGNAKYSMNKIPIYPNWDQTNNFVEWIQELESNIFDCFPKKTDRELSSLISKKNNLTFIKTNFIEPYKITSDIDNKNISLADFKINGQIELVIKISYIWSRENKIGLSSQLYQIKYLAPPDQLNINFIDPEPKYVSPIIQNKPIIKPEINVQVKNTVQPETKSVKMVPSLDDLNKAIKQMKLKSINKE